MKLNRKLPEGPRYALIDTKNTNGISSEGYGLLLEANRALRARNGYLVLHSFNKTIENKLRITKLNTIFTIFNTREEALEFLAEESENPFARF
ncbi:MAG: STAS domain-containing protein [Candidatus Woesearchaeota archaeon]